MGTPTYILGKITSLYILGDVAACRAAHAALNAATSPKLLVSELRTQMYPITSQKMCSSGKYF